MPMPDPRPAAPSSSGSALVLSALVGAVAGAVGLAWWLRNEAQRRRHSDRQRRLLRLSRSQELPGAEDAEAPSLPARAEASEADSIAEGPLRDRVLQLNRAIDEVRRQLEALQTHP